MPAGTSDASSVGGAGGLGSGGDENIVGHSGGPGYRTSSSTAFPGQGGSSTHGGGAPSPANSVAGIAPGGGYGGGGSGGSGTSADRAGGAGAAGVVIVEEYS
jgi:hypothetical protein